MNSLFQQGIRHLQPLYYQQIADSKTYLFLKSYFKPAWCSFLVPKVDASNLNWDKTESIVDAQEKNGYVVSYYIHQSLNKGYRVQLMSRGYKLLGNDAYLYKSLSEVKLTTAQYKLIEATEDSFQAYVDLSAVCFPDWTNNHEYCRHIFELSKRNDHNIMEKNYFVAKGDEKVGLGAMLMNRGMNLAYIHNLGTAPEHRRRGVFTWLVKAMETIALGTGISQIYSIAQADSVSYKGFTKMGYDEVERYYLYAKVNS